MTKKFLLSLLPTLLLCVAGLMACDDKILPEGKWPPMEWETDNGQVVGPNNDISVPAEGGTYSFTCINYSKPWICHVKEDEEYFLSSKENMFKQLSGNWTTVKVNQTLLTISISQNDGQEPRTSVVEVEEGDAFSRFTFNQSAP